MADARYRSVVRRTQLRRSQSQENTAIAKTILRREAIHSPTPPKSLSGDWCHSFHFVLHTAQPAIQASPSWAVRFRQRWRRPSRAGIDNPVVQVSPRTLGSRELRCSRLFGPVLRNRRTTRHELTERLEHTVSTRRMWYSTESSHVARSKRQGSISANR